MPEIPPLPPIASQPISVVLLARDEEPHLEAVLRLWLDVLGGLNRDFEIILVNDGSRDRTLEIATGAVLATGLGTGLGSFQVLNHEQPQGIGAALRTGLATSRFPLLFYTTADREYRPADISLLLGEIDKVHLLSGYRRGQPVPWPLRGLGFFWRLVLRVVFDLAPERLPGWLGWKEHLYRMVIRLVFAVRTRDMNCAFRLCRRHIFARIPIQSNGPFAHTEILIKANFLGCVLGEEVPIAHQPRLGSLGDWTGSDYRKLAREGLQVFKHADFGPPEVVGWPEPNVNGAKKETSDPASAPEASEIKTPAS